MNKRFLLLFTAFMLLSASCFPQKKFEGGLTVGTGITDFRGLDAEYIADDISFILSEIVEEEFPIESYPRTFTFNFGGFVIYNVLPWLGIRGGAEYVQKGQGYGGELYLSTNLNMESEDL